MKVHDDELQTKKAQHLGGWDMFRSQGVIILIMIFFLAFAPLLPSTSRYRGDERFYTDAAIRMVQTGDYLTPYYYDGTLRLRKPIFIYWTLAASYKIFGINLFSSRVPFLIAGCLIIWFTYKLSLVFFRRQEWSFIAAAVIASNFNLYHISVRSTPDTFLCLFVSMSLYGFARIIFDRDRRMVNYIFAYVGAGLAAATKGGWGVLPVAFAFSFCFFRKGDTITARELIDIKSIVIGLFIASFWYIIAYAQHGDLFVRAFLSDQVGGDIFSGSKWYIVENMFAYTFAVVREFMPWSFIFMILLITRRDKDMIMNFFREHREACIFIIGWYLSLCLLFSLGNIQRTRYLLPAFPLVSILYAAIFVPMVSKGRGLSSSILELIERFFLVTSFLLGLCLALAGIFIDIRLVVGGILAIFVVAVLYATLFRRKDIRRNNIYGLVTISLCIMLNFSVSENFISRVIFDSPAPRVVEKVREYTQGPIEIAAMDLSEDWYRSQIYVLSGGHVTMDIIQPDMNLAKLQEFQFIVLSERSKEQLHLDGYTVEDCGYSYKKGHFTLRSLLRIRTADDVRALLSEVQQRYYLLIKPEAPHDPRSVSVPHEVKLSPVAASASSQPNFERTQSPQAHQEVE